ncbi:MAG: DNA methyltransferase [Atribacterota bacterium]
MNNKKVNLKTEKELREAILREKEKGTPDIEIGRKYGVTFRYIERLITQSQGLNISSLKVSKKVKTLYPKDFKEEQTTVWSFKQRGNWATHSGEYRGNWSPYIPRNVILKYSKPGELVLDYFCGAGTTAVECKLLNRKCLAFDINDKAIELAKENINFNIDSPQLPFKKVHAQTYEPKLLIGDARDLSSLEDNSIDLICAHPPYANIIHYTDSKEGDLSFFDINEFLKEMEKVAKESFRVLKPGRQCAILIGDTRRKKHIIPLGFKLINVYLNAGFKLRELVIKRQHNCKTTGFWYNNSIKYNFLLLAHEYLPIFEKPKPSALSVEERKIDYNLITPTLGRPSLKRKLSELETTTVWVLPEKDFEKYLNKNIIDRYSDGDGYSTIFLNSQSKHETKGILKKEQQNMRLLFVKSPYLNNNPILNIKHYLQEINEIVNRELKTITDNGYIVIQTQDIREGGYVQPLVKKIIDMFTQKILWLKEIVIVTREGVNEINLENQSSSNYLKIVHQYLLVYKVIKGER